VSELAEAAARADALAQDGSERELAELRAKWADDLEAAARSADFRERAVAFRAIGQFRWRADEQNAARYQDDQKSIDVARNHCSPALNAFIFQSQFIAICRSVVEHHP
jgi:hypothetical protein